MTSAFSYRYDINKLKAGLRPYLIDAMNKASDELLKRMKINVHEVTYVGKTGKGAPGDPAWRDEVDRDLRKLYERYADDILEVGVGADYSEDRYAMIRAMVIAYGAGSAVGNPAIHAGPYGRSVLNDSLTGHKESRADEEYDLPEEFNHKGNNFIEKAVEETQTAFQTILNNALKNIPNHVYTDALVRI